MAKQIITMLTDDIDGGDADETLSFALDGQGYEIDLNSKNAKKIREFLSTYIEAGNRTGKVGAPAQIRRHQQSALPYTTASSREENQKIREWANQNGYPVSERGRIPQEVQDAYQARSNAKAVVKAVKGTSRAVSFRKP